MHIIDHTAHDPTRRNRRKHKKLFRIFLLISSAVFVSYAAYIVYWYAVPVDAMRPIVKNISKTTEPSRIAWPSYGQSAVGEKEHGLLSSSPNQTPRPTASVAKVMTALAILRKKPINKGETGPAITLTKADVELYNMYISKDGSVVKVNAGETISQYQALQAVLLPSANNMADSLSLWAFGSNQEYLEYANNLAVSLGMKQTTISDASGFSPQTMSTASDLVILARAALREPVLVEIVNQQSAIIPVHGEIKNVNWLLGSSGVVGMKTGNTDEAGGCFMVTANRTLSSGEKKTLIAVVLGAPTRNKAMNDSLPLLTSTESNYVPVKIATKGQTVGYYNVPWGGNVRGIAKNDVTVSQWRGAKLKPKIAMIDAKVPLAKGAVVGTVSFSGQDQQSDIVLADDVSSPPTSWRLRRAF